MNVIQIYLFNIKEEKRTKKNKTQCLLENALKITFYNLVCLLKSFSCMHVYLSRQFFDNYIHGVNIKMK